MDRKRILFFIQNFGRPAGSERVTALISSAFASMGHEVAVLSICGNNCSFYPIHESIKLYTLIDENNVDNRKNFFRVLKRLRKFYSSHPVDIVIDVMPSLSIYTLLLRRRFHYKNITWEHFNFKQNTGMCWYGRRAAIRYSNHIVTLTDTDKKFYTAGGCRENKIDSIYNPSPFPKGEMHSFDNKNVVSIGRLSPEKGYGRLLDIWKRIENKTDWILHIYGGGEEKKNLIKMIESLSLERVYIHDPVKNIEKVYKNSNIYISTSYYEGLPMTMIEAQCFGLPIVSFDYDTGPIDIISDGVDGILIKRDSEDAMIDNTADCLLSLINNKDEIIRLSENALKSRERFKTDLIMDRWNRIIEEL